MQFTIELQNGTLVECDVTIDAFMPIGFNLKEVKTNEYVDIEDLTEVDLNNIYEIINNVLSKE